VLADTANKYIKGLIKVLKYIPLPFDCFVYEVHLAVPISERLGKVHL